ncbi:MFS general substrate transporter [Lentinula novae-zelandiae]|nr:MFS general substrate transporter [Lentinula novae-zelandiae]
MTIDETASLLSVETSSNNDGCRALSNYGTIPHTEQDEDHIATSQRSLLAIHVFTSWPLVFVGIFLVAMDSTIVVASYASIGNELKQLSKVSWIATGYMLTLTSFQPLYGKLSDIFGRKSCLLLAYIIFALGSLLCGLSRTMDQLIWARALAGIGGGGMSTVVSIILSDIVPLRSRGVWQGVINIVFASGSSVGAPLGGFLADTIGWRWAFLIQFPAVILAVISVSLALNLPAIEKTDFGAKIKRVDFAGAASLVTCIFFLLFGLDNGGNVSWTDRATVGSLLASTVLFILFGAIEMEWAKEPFAPKRIVLNRSLIASYLVNFFSIASNLSMLFHVSLYLQAVEGLSPSRVGFWLVPGIIGGVTGSLGSGLIMKATGKYYWLTVLEYILLVGGSITIVLSAGVAIHSAIVISIGNYLWLVVSGLTFFAQSCSNGLPDKISTKYVILVLEIVRRVRESLDYLNELDQSTRTIVLGAYEDAIQKTMWFSFSMGVCAFVASLFINEVPLNRR